MKEKIKKIPKMNQKTQIKKLYLKSFKNKPETLIQKKEKVKLSQEKSKIESPPLFNKEDPEMIWPLPD
jgi:hypothetical protein